MNSRHNVPLLLAVLAVMALVMASWQAGASSSNAHRSPQPTKIAIVDLQEVLNNLEEMKSRRQSVQDFAQTLQEELNSMKSRYETAVADAEMLPLNSAEREEKEAEAVKLELTLQSLRNLSQRRIDLKAGDNLRVVYASVVGAITAFAQREGYDMVIFDDRAIPLPNGTESEVMSVVVRKHLFYVDAALDITQDVIQAMNAEYVAPSAG